MRRNIKTDAATVRVSTFTDDTGTVFTNAAVHEATRESFADACVTADSASCGACMTNSASVSVCVYDDGRILVGTTDDEQSTHYTFASLSDLRAALESATR